MSFLYIMGTNRAGLGTEAVSYSNIWSHHHGISSPSFRGSDFVSQLLSGEVGGIPGIRDRLPTEDLDHLSALARDPDPEMFFEGLRIFGIHQEQAGRPDVAALVYHAIARADLPSFLSPETAERDRTALQEIQQSAARRLLVLRGQGSFGEHSEILFRSFSDQVLSPEGFLAMWGAGTVFRLTRLAVLGELTSSPMANLLTRGLGAQAVAGLSAYGAEVFAFTSLGYGVSTLLGRPPEGGLGAYGRNLASAALVLGGLRLTGMIATQAGNRWLQGESAFLQFSRIGQRQLAMLGGIMAGHGLEVAFNLRAPQSPAAFLSESFITLAQFNIADDLMRRTLGPRVQAWELALDRKADLLAEGYRRFPHVLFPNLKGLRAWTVASAGDAGPFPLHVYSMGNEGDGDPPSAKPVLPSIGGETSEATPEARVTQPGDRFRVLAESAGDVFVEIDAKSVIQYINPAAQRIFGYAPEELIGQPLVMLIPENLRELHRQGFARYLEHGVRKINWGGTELPAIHKNGQEVFVEVSFGEGRYEDGQRFFTGTMRDITERKKLETERKRLEAELEAALGGRPQKIQADAPLEVRDIWELFEIMKSSTGQLMENIAARDLEIRFPRDYSSPAALKSQAIPLAKLLSTHARGVQIPAERRVSLQLPESGSRARFVITLLKSGEDFMVQDLPTAQIQGSAPAQEGGALSRRATGAHRPVPETSGVDDKTSVRDTQRRRIPIAEPAFQGQDVSVLRTQTTRKLSQVKAQIATQDVRLRLEGSFEYEKVEKYFSQHGYLQALSLGLSIPEGRVVTLAFDSERGSSEISFSKKEQGFIKR